MSVKYRSCVGQVTVVYRSSIGHVSVTYRSSIDGGILYRSTDIAVDIAAAISTEATYSTHDPGFMLGWMVIQTQSFNPEKNSDVTEQMDL